MFPLSGDTVDFFAVDFSTIYNNHLACAWISSIKYLYIFREGKAQIPYEKDASNSYGVYHLITFK